MSRKPDTACAGGCGQLIWRGTGSTPRPVCRSCRRKLAARTCEQCGRPFRPKKAQRPRPEAPQRFCSPKCVADYRRVHEDPRTPRVANSRRRRAIHAATWDGVKDTEILERDGWTCRIPGCESNPIPREIPYPHPLSASIDHIIPLSLGGTDTAGNKRASHLVCNVRRGNRDTMSTGRENAEADMPVKSELRSPRPTRGKILQI
jgi:hypothetical protein